jgi:Zn-dependent protease with chaperone function
MAQHQMIHGWQGTLTYSWAAVYLAMVLLAGLWLGLDGYQAVGQLSRYEQLNLDIAPATSPDQTLSGKTITSTTPARLLPTGFPYIAQIGLWRPQLVLSQGLLDQLDHLHLDAVLCHEAAHLHYSDTAWFAGLGLLRRCSGWLPNTDALWQELLLLRELRADRWAAQRVDPLLLAEALFTVVSTPLYPDSRIDFSAAFNEQLVSDRLNERVDALLQATPPDTAQNFQTWRSLLLLIVATAVVGLPLWTLALHY